ncbi:MAG: prepilin-type cleavage/methylation domain-containing protein, partial [Gammaproteobacteria bacterium]
GPKTAIASYYSGNNQLPTSNTQAGIADATAISGESVKSVEIDPDNSGDGEIVVTFTSKVDGGDPTIIIMPNTTGGSINWTCTGGTLLNKYRPANCR